MEKPVDDAPHKELPKSPTGFFSSKRYSLDQADARIAELAMSEDDIPRLKQLTTEELEDLVSDVGNCIVALQSIEQILERASEEASARLEGDENHGDGDKREHDRISVANERPNADDKDWHLMNSYGPTHLAATKDVCASQIAAALISASPMQCWYNARRLIEAVEEYADANLVEGYALLEDGVPIEHGWVVVGQRIIDPTLPEEACEYFPGLEFSGRGEIAHFQQISVQDARRQRDEPFFHAFGWHGHGNPHMKKAFALAMERAKQGQDD